MSLNVQLGGISQTEHTVVNSSSFRNQNGSLFFFQRGSTWLLASLATGTHLNLLSKWLDLRGEK